MPTELENHNAKKKYAIVVAVVLASMTIIGMICSSVSTSQTIPGYIRAHINIVLILSAICLFFFYYYISFAYNKIDIFNQNEAYDCTDKYRFEIDKKMWLKFFLIISVCWIPYLVLCFPADTRGYDYFWQLLQGLGIFPVSDHHPVLSSYVFGVLFSAGYKIGGADGGFFFTMVVQFIAMAGSLSFALSCISAVSVSRKCVMTVCLFISLCPVFPTHAIWLCKDSFFTSISIILFMQVFVNVWCSKNKVMVHAFASPPVMAAVSVLFCLYRHGVIIIAAILMFITCIVNIKKADDNGKKNIIIKWSVSFIAFILVILGTNVVLDHAKITKTNVRESLSMPVRQIMRTIQLNPDDKIVRDKSILPYLYREEIHKGESIQSIANRYNDCNADYIKTDYIYDKSKLKELVKLWFKTGTEHPGCYMDAAIRGTYGYWWLEIGPEMMNVTTELGKAEDDFANEKMKNEKLNNLFLPTVKSLKDKGYSTDISFCDLRKKNHILEDIMNVDSRYPVAREKLKTIIWYLQKTPVVSLVFMPGLYFWIMIFCFGYLFSRKKEGRYIWPVLLLEAIAWVSPVNGYTRYVVSAELISLLLICMCFTASSKYEKADQTGSKEGSPSTMTGSCKAEEYDMQVTS